MSWPKSLGDSERWELSFSKNSFHVFCFAKYRAELRRTHKTLGSFMDHIRGFIHITFSIGLVPGAAWWIYNVDQNLFEVKYLTFLSSNWSYWTFGTCCTSAILSSVLLLLVLWERMLLKLLNYVALLARIQEKREKLNKKRYWRNVTLFTNKNNSSALRSHIITK